MFLILLDYMKPLDAVDAHLDAHRAFLARHYADGSFLLSGRKEPRTGGVILARAPSREAAEALVREDPFHATGVARYTVIEFHPTLSAPVIASLVDG